VAAPALNAAAVVATKFAVMSDSVDTTMLWISTINLLLTLPALALPWSVDAATVPTLAIIVVLGPLGTYLSLWAVRFADVSALAPFDYTRLIVNSMAALILFREMPTRWGFVGMAIIIAGCLASSRPAKLPVSIGLSRTAS
jgi:drug/metabolite transporter (DMT)-like permease